MSATLRNQLESLHLPRVGRVRWAATPLALLAALLALPAMARAEQPAAPAEAGAEMAPIESLSPLDVRVLSALDKPISVEFCNRSLLDVVHELQDLVNVNVRLDERALEDAGLGTETAISVAPLKDMPLRSVLSLLRLRYDLYFMIQNGMLLITTHDMETASENLVRKVYPVGDFVYDGDYKNLLEAITNTVEPNTWAQGGGSSTAVAVHSTKSLVIAQTRDAHDKILQLLRSLRTARKSAPVAPARS